MPRRQQGSRDQQPAHAYQLKGTVEFAVETYLKKQGSMEPARVIHRLDRGTSGLMVFPKNRRYAARLSTLLKEGKVERRTLLHGYGNRQQVKRQKRLRTELRRHLKYFFYEQRR